jgi:hypothetical protein
MRVPEEVRQCVIFVGLPVNAPDGRKGIKPKGTAFFVSILSESDPKITHTYIATAKHVAIRIEGSNFAARVNTKDGHSKRVLGEGTRWWYHPTDPSVDVAIIPWAPPQEVEFKSIPTKMFISEETLQNEDIGIGDEVFMTGLFAHLSGSKRNIPIIRLGNIAMIPNEPVPTSIGTIEAYLIEARSIGGLSGSPVFVHKITKGRGKLHLLGLMHGHWDIPTENKNDLDDKDFLGSVNMGIAIVVPAKKILEVLNQPELVELRRKSYEKYKQAKQNS